MILALLRKDPAVRALRWGVPVAVLSAVLFAWVSADFPTPETLSGVPKYVLRAQLLPIVAGWIIGLSLVRPWLRATELHLSLPIPGSVLVRARLLALAAYTAAPAIAFLAVLAVLAGPQPLAKDAALLITNLASALLLALALVQSIHPARATVPAGPALAGAVILGMLALGLAVTAPSILLAGLLLAAAIAVAKWTEIRVPKALSLVPAVQQSTEDAPAKGSAPRAVLTRLLLMRFLEVDVFVAVLVVWWLMERSSWIQWPSLLVIVPLSLWGPMKSRLASAAWLDPLPVSRRLLFAAVALPGLLALTLGIVGGELLGSPPTAETVDFKLECPGTRTDPSEFRCNRQVQVPRGYWRLSRLDTPPAVGSPWGETVRPPLHHLMSVGPWALYNPYAVGGGSSLEFVALQLSRAVRDVHGLQVPAEEIGRRYLRRAWDGTVGLVGDGFTLTDDVAPVRPAHGSSFAPAWLTGALVWFWVGAVALRAGTPSPRRVRRGLAVAGLAAVLLAFSALGLMSADLAPWASEKVLGRVAALEPDAPVRATAIAAAVVAGLVLILARRFDKVELKQAAAPRQNRAVLWLSRLFMAPILALPLLYLVPPVQALHMNVFAGSERWVRIQLWLGMSADSLDEKGDTPLSVAADRGHSRIVRLLLVHGADANARDGLGLTPLQNALWSDDAVDRVGTVTALLEYGTDVKATGVGGVTPLIDAADRDRSRVILPLVARGADMEARTSGLGYTALMRAAEHGNRNAVRALLAAGARRDPRDSLGRTAREIARGGGHEDVVALLDAVAATSQ